MEKINLNRIMVEEIKLVIKGFLIKKSLRFDVFIRKFYDLFWEVLVKFFKIFIEL